MAKIPSYRRIVADDYAPEYQELVSNLGYIINDFMQNSTDAINGNIDFENLSQTKITLTGIQTDSAGKPLSNSQVNVKKNTIDGMSVIKVINTSNTTSSPDFMPNIKYTELGNNLIRIDKIPGLVAGNKYNITIVVY